MRTLLFLSIVVVGCGSAQPKDEEHSGGVDPRSMTPSAKLCAHSRPVTQPQAVAGYGPALAERGFTYEPVDDQLDCSGDFEKCHARTFLFRHSTSGAQLIGITSTGGRALVAAQPAADCKDVVAFRTLALEASDFVVAERVLGACASGRAVTTWLIADASYGRVVGDLVCDGTGTFDLTAMTMTCNGATFAIDVDKLPYCHEAP